MTHHCRRSLSSGSRIVRRTIDKDLASAQGRVTVWKDSRCLYAYRDKKPILGAGTALFDSAEITGDVVVGEDTLIGAVIRRFDR